MSSGVSTDLAWVDVETTGLDPDTGFLLEVGVILTNGDLAELDRTSVLIKAPPNLRATMDDEVYEMHHKGLLEACESGIGTMDRENAQTYLCRWLNERVKEPPVMAGSTVSFDRAWLKAKMPLFEQQFHYRNVDVSTLRELNRRWEFAPEWEGDRDLHRSLPDLEDSIAQLKLYREAFEKTARYEELCR